MMNSNFDVFWWQEQSEDALANNIWETVKDIEKRQNYRSADNKRYYKMYVNADFPGLLAHNYSNPTTLNKISFNVIQSTTDTIVSKIGKNKPKPYFLTNNGDWTIQERAKKLNAFVLGQFYQMKTYKKSKKSLKDGGIFGTGFKKIYNNGVDKIFSEWTPPEEIKVDDRESIYGSPRSLYQVKIVSKEVLKAKYPNKASKIEDSSMYFKENTNVGQTKSNLACVIEAWHLPSSKDANDGRHSIILSECTLLDERYKRDKFPFVKINFTDKPLGFWGMGISEILFGIQMEINKTLRTIQKSHHLVSVPKVLYQYGSKIVKSHFNNEVGAMIGFTGAMPQYIAPSGVNPALMEYLEYLYRRAYEMIGITQLSSQGKKPSGLNSGRALREYNDIETERFADLAQSYEDMHVEEGEHIIDNAKEIYEKNKDFGVLAKKGDFVEHLKWSDVKLDESEYLMQAYPTNLLPNTPEGRLETIQDMISIGLINQQEASNLLDYPDVNGVMKIKNSTIDDIMKTIELFLNNKYASPEPFQDLSAGIGYMNNAYLYYKNRSLDEDKLDYFRRWISEAMLILNPPAPEQPPISDNTPVSGEELDEQDAINEQEKIEAEQLSSGTIPQGV